RLADRGLDADRQPGFTRDPLDEVEHLVGVPERAVRRRADAVAILRDAADLGDLAADLRARQDAAKTRLGALTELDFDRPDLRATRHRLRQPRHAEAAVRLAASEVPGADLPDEIAALQVMRGDAALSGALQAAGNLCAAVQR